MSESEFLNNPSSSFYTDVATSLNNAVNDENFLSSTTKEMTHVSVGSENSVSNSDDKMSCDLMNNSNSLSGNDSQSSVTISPTVLYLNQKIDLPRDSIQESLSDFGCDSEEAIKKGNDKRPYICDICNKSYKRRAHLNVHLYTHNKEKPYKCEVCNVSFTHKYFLRNHEFLHSTEKQFLCKICDKEFSVRRYFMRHMRRHTLNTLNTYLCDSCDFTCNELRELNVHVKSHDSVFHVCDKCNRHFCKEINRDNHICFNSDIKRFSCDLCSKTYKQLWGLQLHLASHSNKKEFECQFCNKRFNYKRLLQLHMNHVHLEEHSDKFFSCPVCEKKFHLEINMRRHMQFHSCKPQSQEKPKISVQKKSNYTPKNCGVQIGYLNVAGHISQPIYFIPGKNINYVCDVCLKGFRLRNNLTVHYRIHTGEKPYECKVCEKRFTSSCDLSRHNLTHTGEKKHVCELCNKRFSRRCNMRTHYQRCIRRRKTDPGPPVPKIVSVLSEYNESI